MSGLPVILAGLMLVAAVVSAANLAAALSPASWLPMPRSSRGLDVDIAYLLMGIAMAGMLAPNVRTLPSPAWEVVFGLLTAWFGWHLLDRARLGGLRSLARGHGAAHLLHCAAMVYMYVVPGPLNICAAGGPKFPALAQLFGLVLTGYSVRDLGQLSGPRREPGGTPAMVCRIFMGVTTASMLLFAG